MFPDRIVNKTFPTIIIVLNQSKNCENWLKNDQ